MSLGRPDRGSVDDKDRLFQILTGLYDAVNGNRTSISLLEQRIITVTDASTTTTTTETAVAVSPLDSDREDGAGGSDGPAPGAPPGTNLARVWVSTADPSLPYAVNMGALGTGVLQHTVTAGVSAPSAFAVGTGLIPFGDGASLLATNADLSWSNATGMLIDNATGTRSLTVQGNTTIGVNLWIKNTNAANSAFASQVFVSDAGHRADVYFTSSTYASSDSLPSSLTIGTDSVSGSVIFSPQQVRVLRLTNPHAYLESGDLKLIKSGFQVIEKQGTGDLYIGTLGAAQAVLFYTHNATVSLSVEDGGEIQVRAGSTQGWYNAGGANFERVRAFWSANVWNLKSEKGVGGTVRAMKIDADTSTVAVLGAAIFLGSGSSSYVTVTASTAELSVNDGSIQTWYNAGASDFVKASWGSNVWTLKSLTSGGTVRAMTIDADTATLTLRGATTEVNGSTGLNLGYLAGVVSTGQVQIGASTSIGIGTVSGGTSHPSANFSASQLAVDVSQTIAFASGATWNGLNIAGTASITGTGTITSTVFATTNFAVPSITSGSSVTVTSAATVYIAGAPIASGSTSISSAYAFWVGGGTTRLEGDLITLRDALLAGSGKNLGFFGSAGTTKQAPTGSRGGNAALASLLTALAAYGLITDSTSA